MADLTIVTATEQAAVDDAGRLFRDYEAWLGLDLCFQGFEAELAELPGKYTPPSGGLFVAYRHGEPAGCIAFRPFGVDAAEMKRLFVRPDHQGRGLGRILTELVITECRRAGHSRIILDTLPAKMGSAVGLYRSLGFTEIPPYYDNPNAGVLFMELTLGQSADHIP